MGCLGNLWRPIPSTPPSAAQDGDGADDCDDCGNEYSRGHGDCDGCRQRQRLRRWRGDGCGRIAVAVTAAVVAAAVAIECAVVVAVGTEAAAAAVVAAAVAIGCAVVVAVGTETAIAVPWPLSCLRLALLGLAKRAPALEEKGLSSEKRKIYRNVAFPKEKLQNSSFARQLQICSFPL